MPKKSNRIRRIAALFGSRSFFWAIVALLAFEAAWIALSNRYPMAFDEDYHVGIIKLYAQHLSPFWSGQPANADVFGAVFRDPSYIYHYLLSFVYRIDTAIFHTQAQQVIALRFVNIALLCSSLVVFRKLLQAVGLTTLMTNFVLLLLVLIPVVPLLGAQVNYDNLFIPVVGLLLLWTVTYTRELRTYNRINAKLLIMIVLVSIFGSLIKYPFLPFALAAFMYLAFITVFTLRSSRKLKINLLFGLSLISKRQRIIFALLFVLLSGLWIERYGVNIVRYHTPVPDCSQALSVQSCSAYGPWIRDYTLSQQKVDSGRGLPYYFAHEWLYGMWFRLFFMVDGPEFQFQTRGPLTIPARSAIVFGIASCVLVVAYARRLWSKYGTALFAPVGIGLFYVLVLILDGFESYHRTGHPVAINGRYLLPILPLMMGVSVLAWNELLRTQYQLKYTAALVAVACMVWGGGLLTFILRSDDSWYWKNSTVQHSNYTIRHTLGPVVPGYTIPTQYLR